MSNILTMPGMTISAVAHKVGLEASAVRYYERIGLLAPAPRIGGQRRYDTSVLHSLAVVQRARQLGFTLEEIRRLFFGFRQGTRASQRWQKLSRKKLAELDLQLKAIRTMQRLLREMIEKCRCESLEQCGGGIFAGGCARPADLKGRGFQPRGPRPEKPRL